MRDYAFTIIFFVKGPLVRIKPFNGAQYYYLFAYIYIYIYIYINKGCPKVLLNLNSKEIVKIRCFIINIA